MGSVRGTSHVDGDKRDGGETRGVEFGRPRLSAIKIIPFLPAAERKELTSTLPRGTPGVLLSSLSSVLLLPVLVPRALPSYTHPLVPPDASLSTAPVSIAILIVSSSSGMTGPRGTARNESATPSCGTLELGQKAEYVATLLCPARENCEGGGVIASAG